MMALSLTSAMLNFPVGSVVAEGSGIGSPFNLAGDLYAVSGFRRKTPSHGKNLEQGFSSLELVYSRGAYRAEHRHGLAAKVGDGDRHLRLLDIRTETGRDLGLELLDREAGRAHSPDQREIDVATDVDANGPVADLFGIQRLNGDIVVRSKNVFPICDFHRRWWDFRLDLAL